MGMLPLDKSSGALVSAKRFLHSLVDPVAEYRLKRMSLN